MRRTLKTMLLLLLLPIAIFLASGCSKQEATPTPEVPVTSASADLGILDTNTTAVTDRVSINGTWNVNLANFRYVHQNYLPQEWTNDNKYNTSGPCNFPRYIGNPQCTTISNSNLCGLATYMIGMQLVPHDVAIDLPVLLTYRANRLAETAKRYKLFDASYYFGGYTAISNIRSMANGTSTKKGDFTNWANCSQMTNPSGTSLLSTSSRQNTKDFHLNYLALNRPVACIIGIRSQYGSADNPNYMGGTQGHFVLLVGLSYYDNSNYYKARFKDPWTGNSKTYEVNYSVFLDAMKTSTTYYNSLAILGQ